VVRASALLAQHTSRPLAIRAKGKALLHHALEEHAVGDLEVRSDMRHVAVIYGFKLLGIVHVARQCRAYSEKGNAKRQCRFMADDLPGSALGIVWPRPRRQFGWVEARPGPRG
jgi:hypothetical protein